MDDGNITIKVATDFTDSPGGRLRESGDFSGESFYEDLLKDKFEQALKAGTKLEVDFDGSYGYAASFISEVFGRLSREHDHDTILKVLSLKSTEDESLIIQIKEALYGRH